VIKLEIPFDGVSDDEIIEIYKKYKRIAIVGMSRDSKKDSHRVGVFLRDKGYEVIPVNPVADYIAGLKSYKNILDIPDDVDVVDIFRPSEAIPPIIEDAIKKRVKVVWLQEGIYHPDVKKLKEHGIKVIWNRCMMREYKRLIEK